jgi:hypothetical protein
MRRAKRIWQTHVQVHSPHFFRNKTKFSNRINWNTDIRMYMHALRKNMWHPKIVSIVEQKQIGCWNETRHFSRERTVEPGRIDVTYCRYIVTNKWHLNLCIEIQSTVNWNSYCVHFTCVNMYKQLHSCAASKILQKTWMFFSFKCIDSKGIEKCINDDPFRAVDSHWDPFSTNLWKWKLSLSQSWLSLPIF